MGDFKTVNAGSIFNEVEEFKSRFIGRKAFSVYGISDGVYIPIYPGTDSKDDRYQSIIRLFSTSIINTYYKSICTKEIDEEYSKNVWSQSPFDIGDGEKTELLVNKIFRNIRILRRSKDLRVDSVCVARLANDHTAYKIFITPDNDEEKCSTFSCILEFSENELRSTVMFLFKIDLKAVDLRHSITHKAKCCMVLSDRNIEGNAMIQTLMELSIIDFVPNNVLTLLLDLLEFVVEMKDLNPGDPKHAIPCYTSAELSSFKKAFKINGIDTFCQVLKNFAVEKEEDVQLTEDCLEYFKPGQEDNEFPIVKLSNKEWKFVDNWLENNNVFKHDPVNLHTFFDSPRYGNKIKLPYSRNGEEAILCINYHFIDDRMEIYAYENLTSDSTAWCQYVIHDPDNFTDLKDNLKYIVGGICTTDVFMMPNGESDIRAQSVIYTMDAEELGIVIRTIMKIFAILHYRPDRTRTIKCSENRRVYRNKNNKKDYTEREYTVWRILAPVKDAKDYVQRMSTGPRRDAVYTLEEWERSAHYRTLKSGKVIYINATHCKRRKPIKSDVEIRIKL